MRRMLTSLLLTATVGVFATYADAANDPTRAQAVAFAQAVNLSAADLPGFTAAHAEKEHSTAKEREAEHQLKRCVGAPEKGKSLVELGSKSFARETASAIVSVSSEVTVMPTPALASNGLTVIKSARARKCASHYFNVLISGLKAPGVKIGKVRLSTFKAPAPGTTGSFGWRLSATVTAAKGNAHVSASFYVDILGFVYGRAAVTLLTAGAPQPLPATVEQKLFSLLVGRAKTHGI